MAFPAYTLAIHDKAYTLTIHDNVTINALPVPAEIVKSFLCPDEEKDSPRNTCE